MNQYLKDASLKKALDTKYNFVEWGVISYRELLEKGVFTGKRKSLENAVKFDRRKFNRMDQREQDQFIKRFNQVKTTYNLQVSDNSSFEVSKAIFDYANVPELPETNYVQTY